MNRLTCLLLASAATAVAVPEGFEIKTFAEPFDADYPAAITVAPNGEVYVSSDQNGSIGKDDGMGRIIRCTDTDGDQVADKFVHFVPDVDSPRGGHIVGDTLYLIHPPYLSSFRDTDGDGVADEKKELLSGLGGGIEHPRGADHTTNGVRMGIDGWLYIAVGDFGTTPAIGTDGKQYKLHGGGVIRVRPDGSEVEPFAVMTRNTCDVAISPTLDMFARDNTNDGKGWNTRFHHYTQLADHGYPRLYHNFTDEMVAPLADYGGGSGTGGLWVDEPGFPGEFGDMLYSCDWTTGKVYYHPHQQVGASFEIDQKVFHEVARATDIDVDGFSRLYISDWQGGRFRYAGEGKKVGKIQIVTVKDVKPFQYTDVTKAKDGELVKLLTSASHTQRFEASREILKRDPALIAGGVLQIAGDKKQSIESRVAAIFTFKQLLGAQSHEKLVGLLKDDAVREYALRAMTDRKTQLQGVHPKWYVDALNDPNPRVVQQALVGLERLGAVDAAPAILSASTQWKEGGISPRLRHTAMQVLSSLGNIEALLAGVDAPETRWLSLKALNELHQDEVVDGLIAKLNASEDGDYTLELLTTLARLHFKEADWDGKAWWGTRPDDRGPYFAPVEWEASAKIRSALEKGYTKLSQPLQGEYIGRLAVNRISISKLDIPGLDPLMIALGNPDPTPDQIQVLMDAAKDADRPFDRRLESYQAVLRGKEKDVLPRRIGILAKWSTEDDLPAQGKQAIEDFVNESMRSYQIKELRKIAAKGSDAASTLAWKAIFTVAHSPLVKDKWKIPALELTRKTPKEVGYFNALADLQLPGYDEQIEAGLDWDNDELIAAAKRARKATAGAASDGKRVAELKADKVTEQVMAAAGKGDLAEGKRLYTAQGCIACHAVDPKAVQKGPYLGDAGSKFTRDYLIESILDPNAVVAQGFQTTLITTKDGRTHMGFVTNEADGVIELRNIAGQASEIKSAEIKSQQALPQSMMPAGLGASLTVGQFNSLIDYLVSLKSEQ
ncbi:MAG: c-type cytochrome [Akkermansiaceae bacterium]|nr:c-type cytochrome [Akkermansiaceae bacterium]